MSKLDTAKMLDHYIVVSFAKKIIATETITNGLK